MHGEQQEMKFKEWFEGKLTVIYAFLSCHCGSDICITLLKGNRYYVLYFNEINKRSTWRWTVPLGLLSFKFHHWAIVVVFVSSTDNTVLFPPISPLVHFAQHLKLECFL